MGTATQLLSSIRKGQGILKALTFLNLAGFLWPPHATVNDGDCFDFVIVGGGTAGCILAGRLAELNVSVAIIEAGDEPPLETALPGLFSYTARTDYDFNFTTVPDRTTGKTHRVQQGKLLGGSGQVNYMIHHNGHPEDYNEWAERTDDPSWEYKNICKYFRETEKLKDKRILNSPDAMFHGTEGRIGLKRYCNQINKKYFEAFKEMGHSVVNDINPRKTKGYTEAYLSIGLRIRQGTAEGYLTPVKYYPNLKVFYKTVATKIIFDDRKRAIGVEVLTEDNEHKIIKANKEVILSAGAINSPRLLLLSGVGPKKHLEEKNIQVISDLPVGENLQDHPTVIFAYGMEKYEKISPPNPHEFPVAVIDGYISLYNCQIRADYQTLSGVIKDPKFFLQVCLVVFNLETDVCERLYKPLVDKQIYFVTHYLLYPNSRGTIRLNSTNPEDKPLIDPAYYADENDLERHAKYVKHFNEIVNTTYFKSVGAELADPKLENCKGMDKNTLEYYKCFVQGMRTTVHLYTSTCAMGSVVNSEFRVFGVESLRVCDASIIPKSIGSTTQATVMMIAQKLIDVLKRDYNLCK